MLNKSIDKRGQYEMISISEFVPSNHLLRRVDNGRLSIDSVILVKILLIQRLFRIKSMRQLIKEIETNVAELPFLEALFL